MESKKFCLGEHFTSYDDINVWRGKFCERLDKRFTYNWETIEFKNEDYLMQNRRMDIFRHIF